MEFLLINIVLPVAVGILTEFAIRRIDSFNKHHLLSITIGVLVALIVGFSLLFIPPVNIDGIIWCQDQNAQIKVTGRLTTKLFGFSVAGESVQIKVFEAGESDPLGPETIATTDAQGSFSTGLNRVSLTTGSNYVVNVAYRYSRFILGERWQIADFSRGQPTSCP